MPGKAKAKVKAKTSKARSPAKKAQPKKAAQKGGAPNASRLIDERIRSLADWRGKALATVRKMIRAADPEIVEEVKWVKPSNPWGVAVWSHDGIVCTGEVYKEAVKLTFARGASVADPKKLFNASLDAGTRRAIDIREGETLPVAAFQDLIRAAVAENARWAARKSPKSAPRPKVALLSGGNPQIPKGEGDAPVQAYISAMPGWKRAVGERLDALIEREVPHVRKAVKWNSPFYGVEGQGWFLSYHVFARYVKVTFFMGAKLRPPVPGGTQKEARWIDVHEDDLDEDQLAAWVRQAAAIPGWVT